MPRVARSTCLCLFLVVLLGLVAGASSAGAATLYVANNGVDNPGCGGIAAPCRTINQAIANAPTGATIVVGPGRYGDTNGNGIADAGEEAGCVSCLVLINKTVTVTSRDGAAVTIIDAGGQDRHAVMITASNVTFGKASKGFTLTGAGNDKNGLQAGSVFGGGDRARVTGNVAVGNAGHGFIDLSTIGLGQYTDNRAIGNGSVGLWLAGSNGGELRSNVATGNDYGFAFYEGVNNDPRVSSSLAAGNRVGFAFGGEESGVSFSGNAAHGNGEDGFEVDGPQILARNGVSGNGVCGVRNRVVPTVDPNTVNGNDVYWGVITGPGPDPADDKCEEAGLITSTKFRTTEVKVSVKALK